VDLRFGHDIAASPQDVADALLDPDFQASLNNIGALRSRDVLSQERQNGLVVRRVRCVLGVNVTGVAKKFLGNSDPAWIEVSAWHPDEMRWHWHIEPEVAADLLDARGQIALERSGAGTLRVVSGQVRVKVPLYGGTVERWIAQGLERAYDEEAERLEAWLGR